MKYTKREKELADMVVNATGGYPLALVGFMVIAQSMDGDNSGVKIERALEWLEARGFNKDKDVVRWWQENWQRIEPQIQIRTGAKILYRPPPPESR